jgi:inhibitor of cysteine peptidase
MTLALTNNADNQTTFTVTKQQPQFVVKLKANPTTGYSWSLKKYDSKYLKPLKHYYQASTSQLVGAPGFEFWTFQVKPAAFKAHKKMTIQMMYARPWEKGKGGVKKSIQVVVGK